MPRSSRPHSTQAAVAPRAAPLHWSLPAGYIRESATHRRCYARLEGLPDKDAKSISLTALRQAASGTNSGVSANSRAPPPRMISTPLSEPQAWPSGVSGGCRVAEALKLLKLDVEGPACFGYTCSHYSSKLGTTSTPCRKVRSRATTRQCSRCHMARCWRSSCRFVRLAESLQPRLRRDLPAQVSRFPSRPVVRNLTPHINTTG